MTISPGNAPDGPDDARGRLVASVLRAALAEQRRICLLAGQDFPGSDDCLGRDLSQLTIVVNDPARAAALHDRFGHMIVVEMAEAEAFLSHQARIAEGFDIVIAPDLADNASGAALAAMLKAMAACLRPGGRVALISDQSKAAGGNRFAEIARLADQTPGCDTLTSRICGTQLLVEIGFSP